MGKQQKSSNKNLQPTKVEKAQTVEDLIINEKDLKKYPFTYNYYQCDFSTIIKYN